MLVWTLPVEKGNSPRNYVRFSAFKKIDDFRNFFLWIQDYGVQALGNQRSLKDRFNFDLSHLRIKYERSKSFKLVDFKKLTKVSYLKLNNKR